VTVSTITDHIADYGGYGSTMRKVTAFHPEPLSKTALPKKRRGKKFIGLMVG